MLTSRWASALIGFACLALCAQAQMKFSPCKNRYSPEEQIELGNQSKRQVYQSMPVLPDTSPVTQYIQKLGAKLTAYAPGHQWPYNFHVADVTEINAFALPGGAIFVNLGSSSQQFKPSMGREARSS